MLRDARYRYYVLSDPPMSDAEFDGCCVSSRHRGGPPVPAHARTRPTQQVGTPRDTAFPEYRHLEPMLSLDNAFSREELDGVGRAGSAGSTADDARRYVCELKIDGVAINLVYRDGVLATARPGATA